MSESRPSIHRFGDYELDADRFELRQGGDRVPVEPQVLSLLILLATNHERMLTKDEIIERIWGGRAISDSAVAAGIKAARRVIGDDGKRQHLIRTVHGRGFRFIGPVTSQASDAAVPSRAGSPKEAAQDLAPLAERVGRDGRPSIAVLPFPVLGDQVGNRFVGDALPADIIMDLARLPWLFVIARGSSFRFRGADVDPQHVGRELGARYCLTGTIELTERDATVSVTLIDTCDAGAIWAERYRGALSELQQMRPEIEVQVTAALEVHIPRNEVRIARRRPASELDAWASFHLGLDHMYRFTRTDNEQAAEHFRQSLARDPYFSRAMGGLSFTHFQNVFLRFADDPEAQLAAARDLASSAIEADRLDPFAHFNFGRSLWLEGRLEEAIACFDQATHLSPSYAQGVYNRGLVKILAGKAEHADADLSLALDLSPLDPLAYAMVASRALAHVHLGDHQHAANLAARAALMPGAHKHIALIAAFTAMMAGDRETGRAWLARAQRADPDLTRAAFFRAFPFTPGATRAAIERALVDLGL